MHAIKSLSLCQFSKPMFMAAWSFVLYVSVADAFLLVRSRDVIADMEWNPIGLALIRLADGVWLFFGLKLLGTLTVATLLLLLFQSRPRRATLVVSILAGLQFVLFLFLQYA
ncbi:MAG: hypothetical protein ACTHOU_11465 [Aureliella sp.]